MILTCGIDPFNETGERCGFSASGRPRDEDHSFGKGGQVQNGLRNAKLVRIRQLKGNDTDDSGKRTTLLVSADTVSGKSGQRKRKIIVSACKERFDRTTVCKCIDFTNQQFCCIRHQTFSITVENSVYFVGQWKSGNDKNIRSLCIGGGGEDCHSFFSVWFHGNLLLSRVF